MGVVRVTPEQEKRLEEIRALRHYAPENPAEEAADDLLEMVDSLRAELRVAWDDDVEFNAVCAESASFRQGVERLRGVFGRLLDNIGTSVPPDRPSIQMVQRARAALRETEGLVKP